MAPSPVPQWLSDSPGKTGHCLCVLLSGRANPERTHQGGRLRPCRLPSPVPPSSSVPILQLSQHLAGFGPGFGRGSCLLISTGLTASSQDGVCSSVLGRSGIGNLLMRNSSQARSPYNPGSPLQVCVSPSCVTNAVLSSLGKLARHLMSLLAFPTFQKNYCNVIIIDFSTMHTR